jgi:hypothetical protein
VKDTLDKGIKL